VEPNWRYGLRPLKETIVGDIKPTLTLLLGAMALVLLIATVNVSGVLLARGTVRMREMAVRASLGAGRARLARQVITESALLGAIGGVLGFLLAALLVSGAARIAEGLIPRMNEVTTDGMAAAFALTCGMLAGVLAGVLPALRLPWDHLLTSLRDAGRTASAGPGYGRVRQALVVAEIALTVMIVTGAMLLAKSLFRLQAVDPGFHAEGVLTFRLSLPVNPYGTDERQAAFFAALEERLRAVPGVSSAAFAMALPPDLLPLSNNYTIEGSSVGSQGASGVAEWTLVSPDYFHSMGIRLFGGRTFSAADGPQSPAVAIVNETFVRRHYPDGQAIGKRLKGGDWDRSAPWVTIVGVAADVPYGKGLDGGADATVYRAYSQNLWWLSPFVIVKGAGDPARLVRPVREAVASVDPNLPLRDVATMRERLRTSILEPRARSLLFALLGGLAIALAVTGIYGVMSYHVSQRRREIAIRRVLGAPASQVVRESVASGLRLAAAGVILGVLGAMMMGRSLAAVLYSVNPRDPFVLISVAALLSGCALLACAVPTIRTVALDPALVLRDE
jgi:predicted permease